MLSSAVSKGVWVDRTTVSRALFYAVMALMLVLLIIVLTVSPAQAKTFTVNSTAHPGDGDCTSAQCTLAEAVNEANNNFQGDTIDFVGGLRGEIPLHNTASQGGFSIYDDAQGLDLTINGPGARVLAVNGNDETRDFGIATGANVTISGLSIKNGKTYSSNPDAGGIGNSGILTLDHVTMSGNTAYGYGGAISNAGTLTVTDSTVNGNRSFPGGGIYNYRGGALTISNSTFSGNTSTNGAGGGVASTQTGSTLTITASTFYDNTAPEGGGGGIYTGGGGLSTITNATIAGNNAKLGGGIYNSGTTNLLNTIVAGNTASSQGHDAYGPITSQGNNLIGNISGATGFLGSDLLNRDPLLGPLQNNGGPTNTRALLPGSPAVDAGTNTGCPATDQRGIGRKDGDNNRTVVCDIGAYERSDFKSPTVTSTTPANGAADVKRSANLAASFSEKMSRSTLSASTFELFKVNPDGSTTPVTNVTVSPSTDGRKATLNPFGTSSKLLAANAKYKTAVSTETRDLASNQLDQSPTTAGKQQKVWTFKTGSH